MRNEISKFVAQEVEVKGRVSAVSQHGWCIEHIKVNGEIPVNHSWVQKRDNPHINSWKKGQHVAGKAIVGRYKKPSGIDYNFKAFREE